MKIASVLGALALTVSFAPAQAAEINFDELTSPPVTCCYGNSVTGPAVYAEATITGGPSGTVMNGGGWGNMQTSGENLYGSLDSLIEFLFNADVSGLDFDLINGLFSNDSFNVSIFDSSNTEIGQQTVNLTGFTSPGSVGHLSFANSGIRSARITGNRDFAVDTIRFNGSAVPEPATWALMIGGFGMVGGAMRSARRRTKVSLAA